jgi:hypothetical protein
MFFNSCAVQVDDNPKLTFVIVVEVVHGLPAVIAFVFWPLFGWHG